MLRATVTHPDVDLRFNAASSEFFPQCRGLLLSDSPQRRSSADLRVVTRRTFPDRAVEINHASGFCIACTGNRTISRSEKRLKRNGRTSANVSGPAEIEEQYAKLHTSDKGRGEGEGRRDGGRRARTSFLLSRLSYASVFVSHLCPSVPCLPSSRYRSRDHRRRHFQVDVFADGFVNLRLRYQ